MKKISFKDLESSGSVRKLDFEQMKNLRGGYDGGYTDPDFVGTCGYKGPASEEPICGMFKKYAVMLADQWKGNYCCDSCKSNGGPADYC